MPALAAGPARARASNHPGGKVKAILAIETSTKDYSVAIGTESAASVRLTTTRFEPDFDGIAGLVDKALAEAGIRSSDLAAVAVDIGPGNLTSVRAGVAYANGLAYALDLPIFATDSLSVMAHSVPADAPVLALRPARGVASSEVYAGIYVPGRPASLSRGDYWVIIDELATSLAEQGFDALTVVGAYRPEMTDVSTSLKVQDGGPAAPDASTLLAMAQAGEERMSPGPVGPLTEESETFL
ncbi:tRNA (adenosine(37)-N6)-threonylcarbamoyltransferase complex dimerization subunit type 1 TsaB [Verrucosispora sp. FIM060022]|nr:tRNA (adenosine(37)-N6)-threonylcarbamoyltransferase complex dimerization subunit type 1 TsaB [Verrucosispora sp. FIM060022]